MASPTTLNVGEPADEISVDGSSIPCNENVRDKDDVYEGPKPVKEDYFSEYSNVSEQEIEDMIRYQFFREQKDDDDTTQAQSSTNDHSSLMSDSFTSMFPPLRIKSDDVWFKIAPAIGAACYGYFSVSVMDPEWFGRPFGSWESLVKDVVWVHSNVGAALFLYSKRHVKKAPYPRNIVYSLFGSILFNFGSLVVWGWGHSVLPNSPYLRLLYGAASSGALLYLAHDYLTYVDRSSSEVD